MFLVPKVKQVKAENWAESGLKSIQELKDNMKRPNIRVMGVGRVAEREACFKNIFNENKGNFP